MAKLSPVFNDQTIDANGDPYVGALLFTYIAGSSTKQAVYTTAAGNIPHTNPIKLDSLGFPEMGAIWIPDGISVKFVLALPTDTDPPTSPIKTIDNVQGVNDASVSISEWQSSGVAPTYISTTSFSLPGDQTSAFHKGRRAQFTTSGGTVYGKIINSVFTSLTTVTMLLDGTSVLDAGLSVANLSLLRADVQALPNPIEFLRSAVVGHATLTPTWDRAYGEIQDVSGVITYTAIPAAPRPGATRIWYPATGSIMTNGGSISVQTNANVTAEAGDKWIINAITTTTFYVEVVKKSGLPLVTVNPITSQVFTASGTWTKPAGLKSAKFTITAGGAAGITGLTNQGCGGGGAGGTSIRMFTANNLGATESVTIGAGGTAGGAGANSTFGSLLTAVGGSPGDGVGSGGPGGGASGGDINIEGGGGTAGSFGGSVTGGSGGASFWGGGAVGRVNSGANGAAYGSGGAGGGSSSPGGSGKAGVCFVEMYF